MVVEIGKMEPSGLPTDSERGMIRFFRFVKITAVHNKNY